MAQVPDSTTRKTSGGSMRAEQRKSTVSRGSGWQRYLGRARTDNRTPNQHEVNTQFQLHAQASPGESTGRTGPQPTDCPTRRKSAEEKCRTYA